MGADQGGVWGRGGTKKRVERGGNGARQSGEDKPHRGQVAILQGRAQVQQLPLLWAQAQEHAVEDVEVPLLRGLGERQSPEVAVPLKVIPPAWQLLRGLSARWAPFTEAQLACWLPSSWAPRPRRSCRCAKTT